MATQADLDRIREIVLRRLRGHPVKVYLFGSHATGRAVSASDIDVAVAPEGTLPTGLLSQVREEIESSNVPYRVDLVDLTQTDQGFRQRVLNEGVEWTD